MFRKLIFLCTVCFFAIPLRAQQTKAAIDSLVLKAMHYREQKGDCDTALIFAQKANIEARKQNYPRGLANSFVQIGNCKKNAEDYPAAREAYMNALRIRRDQLGDTLGTGGMYNNLSDLYRREKKTETGIEYSRRAIAVFKGSSGGTVHLAKAYNNMANLQEAFGEPDSAMFYNRLSAALIDKTGDSLTWAQAEYGLGKRYFLLKEYLESETHFKNALAYYETTPNSNNQGFAYNALGVICLQRNDLNCAERNIRRAIGLFESVKDSANLGNAYFNLGLIHTTSNVFDSASFFYEKALFYINRNEDLRSLIKANQEGAKLQQHSIFMTRRNYMLLLISTILAAAAALFWLRSKNRKMELSDMKLRNDKMIEALSNKYLLEQKQVVLEAMHKERERIGKDLHDVVSTRLTVIKWTLESIVAGLKSKKSEVELKIAPVIDSTDQAYREVYNIYHDLKKSHKEWLWGIKGYCQQIARAGRSEINFNHTGVDENIPDEIGTEVEKMVIELVTNALKHAQAQNIYIDLSRIENLLTILVQDDGAGFDPEKLSRESGLNTLKQRVEALQGNIEIKARSGEGTVVNIQIPVELKP
jgi:two-component system, NarL family, sensor kinase